MKEKQLTKGSSQDLSNRRGKLLSTYIIITFFGQITFLFISFFPELIRVFIPQTTYWTPIYIIFDSILIFISLYGLWYMKKWAVLLTAIEIFFSGMILSVLSGSMHSTTLEILVFLVILRRWQYFD